MDIQLGMQHEKAAWKSSMYIQYGDIGMDHGHEALHTALACRVALQNGQA
jgi:acid phosphatase family membrane protein YuiD